MSNTKTISRRALSLVAARGLALGLVVSVGAASVTACGGPRGNERWVSTEDTTVEIDWDAINQAYKDAEGPEDFERRVNEIYEGDEIISVSVKDLDDKTQVVTGFFDKDESGDFAEGEKVFTIQRDIVDPNKAQYAINGYGAYGHYHSPMWDIASGMLMGSMLSRMFVPGYRPMYTTPYTTSAASRGALASQRASFRSANPGKFAKSSSGRSYGKSGGAWGSGGSRSNSGGGGGGGRMGGGRFGVTRPVGRKVIHLA